MSFDLKSFLETAAPSLATMLAGPEAGVALTALEKVTGLTPGSGQDAVATAISNGLTPDQVVELKKADLEHEEHMATIDASQVVAVNTAISAEASGGGWFAKSWRGMCGVSFALYVTSAWVLPLFHLTPVQLSPDLVIALGGILGVHTWHEGVAGVARASK